jgi:PAS domain S-box-containing protein
MAIAMDQAGVLDALPAMVWTARPDGDVDFVNKSWSTYTGRSASESPAGTWHAAAEPIDLPHLLKQWQKISVSGEPGEIEARLRRFDGQYRWFLIQCSPMRDKEGAIIQWCGVATDVDDLRRAEENQRRRDLDFQLIVDSIPVQVAVTTPSGEVEGLNKPTLDYFGIPFEVLKVWKASDVVHPSDLERTATAQLEAHQNGTTYNVESRHRRADGVYRWHNVLGMPLRDPQGRILRWFHLLTDIDDRKQAEEALRRSEVQSKMVLDNVATLVSLLGPDGSPELINRQIIDYTGRTEEDLKRWGGSNLVHADDLPHASAAFKTGIASGNPFDIVYRMRRFDGVYRWFEGHHRPLRNDEGEVVRWCVSVDDIDDRKRIEESLRASENNLQIIINTIPAMAWSARPDGAADFFNQHFLDYVGLSPEQSLDWGWTAAVHPDDLNELVVTWQAILESATPGKAEARLRKFNGEYRWFLFRANPLRDASSNILKWYGTNTDIDDLKRAEDEIRRSEMLLVEGQRISSTGTFSWLVDTDELTFSAQLKRIFGFETDSVVTFDGIGALVHPEDLPLLAEKMAEVRSGRDNPEYDIRLLMADGSIKHLRVFGRVIKHESGRLECIGAVQDVTQSRLAAQAHDKLRSELAHVTRVMSLGAMTASIAHEVNQPLSGIITNASTCLRMLAADPPNIKVAQETARRTIRDGNRAADVITRLRALFSKQAPTIEPIDLNEAAREVIVLSSDDLKRSRVVLRAEFAEELPLVGGDRVQLQQVIINLLRNACDAMSAIDDGPRMLLVRTEPGADDQVRLSVQDAGVGFGPEEAERLFEAFYTTKSDGMGIGLAVSRSIIESHSGRLWAEPNDGPGATFAFSVPSLQASDSRR